MSSELDYPSFFSIRRSLLRAAIHPVPEHHDAQGDEQNGPEPGDAVPLEPIKVVKQQQEPHGNQDEWANGTLPAEIVERVGKGLPSSFGLRRAQSIDGHVDPESRDTNPKRSCCTGAVHSVYAGDEQQQKNGQVNHALAILLVVEGSESR